MKFRRYASVALISALSFLTSCDKVSDRIDTTNTVPERKEREISRNFGTYRISYVSNGSIDFSAYLIEKGSSDMFLNPSEIHVRDIGADGRVDFLDLTFPDGIESEFYYSEKLGKLVLSFGSQKPGVSDKELERFIQTAEDVYDYAFRGPISGLTDK